MDGFVAGAEENELGPLHSQARQVLLGNEILPREGVGRGVFERHADSVTAQFRVIRLRAQNDYAVSEGTMLAEILSKIQGGVVSDSDHSATLAAIRSMGGGGGGCDEAVPVFPDAPSLFHSRDVQNSAKPAEGFESVNDQVLREYMRTYAEASDELRGLIAHKLDVELLLKEEAVKNQVSSQREDALHQTLKGGRKLALDHIASMVDANAANCLREQALIARKFQSDMGEAEGKIRQRYGHLFARVDETLLRIRRYTSPKKAATSSLSPPAVFTPPQYPVNNVPGYSTTPRNPTARPYEAPLQTFQTQSQRVVGSGGGGITGRDGARPGNVVAEARERFRRYPVNKTSATYDGNNKDFTDLQQWWSGDMSVPPRNAPTTDRNAQAAVQTQPQAFALEADVGIAWYPAQESGRDAGSARPVIWPKQHLDSWQGRGQASEFTALGGHDQLGHRLAGFSSPPLDGNMSAYGSALNTSGFTGMGNSIDSSINQESMRSPSPLALGFGFKNTPPAQQPAPTLPKIINAQTLPQWSSRPQNSQAPRVLNTARNNNDSSPRILFPLNHQPHPGCKEPQEAPQLAQAMFLPPFRTPPPRREHESGWQAGGQLPARGDQLWQNQQNASRTPDTTRNVLPSDQAMHTSRMNSPAPRAPSRNYNEPVYASRDHASSTPSAGHQRQNIPAGYQLHTPTANQLGNYAGTNHQQQQASNSDKQWQQPPTAISYQQQQTQQHTQQQTQQHTQQHTQQQQQAAQPLSAEEATQQFRQQYQQYQPPAQLSAEDATMQFRKQMSAPAPATQSSAVPYWERRPINPQNLQPGSGANAQHRAFDSSRNAPAHAAPAAPTVPRTNPSPIRHQVHVPQKSCPGVQQSPYKQQSPYAQSPGFQHPPPATPLAHAHTWSPYETRSSPGFQHASSRPMQPLPTFTPSPGSARLIPVQQPSPYAQSPGFQQPPRLPVPVQLYHNAQQGMPGYYQPPNQAATLQQWGPNPVSSNGALGFPQAGQMMTGLPPMRMQPAFAPPMNMWGQ